MNNVLPIGSVVKLKKIEKPIMVFGYLQQVGKTGKIVDYIGVPYPEGNINVLAQLGFMEEDVEKVFFEGFKDEGFDVWEQKVKEKSNK